MAEPKEKIITHIGIQFSADDGTIWASVTRTNWLGEEVSARSCELPGKQIGAVGRLIERELIAHPMIVSLEVEGNIEGARNAEKD